MRIAICDDDTYITGQIKNIIEEYVLKLKIPFVIREYHCGETLLKEQKKFDIIFLDIGMAEISGIETAKILRDSDKNAKIIFITNYTDMQSDAFGVHAFSYLLKPVQKDQICKVLSEAISYSKVEESHTYVDINTTQGLISIDIEDICYFEYKDRQVKMVTNQCEYYLRQSIGQVESMMEPYGFASPYKCFVVNMLYVKCVRGYDVYMMNGMVLPISQKRSPSFRRALNGFIEKQIMK